MPASSSQPKRTPTRAILDAIKAELVAQAVVPAAAIRFATRDQTPTFQAEQLLVLRPKGFTSLRAEQDGGGRIVGALRRTLAVHLQVRHARDESDRDDQWLLTETEGYMDLEDRVLNILDFFWPADADGNDLTAEPIRILDGSDATKDASDNMWGDGTLYFEMVYLPNRDQSRQ